MFLKADNADADQTAQMHMLILVVIGCTYPKVCFFFHVAENFYHTTGKFSIRQVDDNFLIFHRK